MATSPNGPTPEQIKKVQTNLTNMQAFNDHVYSLGLAKYLNAYLCLSEDDDNDLGLAIGLNIIEGAFWAAGSVAGPAGSFVASFLSGMTAYWMTNTPPSLNGIFAQNVLRFEATTEEVDATLATYYHDVAGNWNTSFTYNGQTQTLSALADFDFPAETDLGWDPLLQAALFGLDQALWTNLLTAYCVITQWYVSGDGTWNGATLFLEDKDEGSPPTEWASDFYEEHPAYYEPWTWYSGDPQNCCGPPACWAVMEYNLGTGEGSFGSTDGSISADACEYLFIDSIPGETINSGGLFKREDVFTNLGISTTVYYVPPGGTVAQRAANISADYLRAAREQRTLGQLLAREGRLEIERRIVQQAQKDSVFAHDLRVRPRITLERFLGVKTPEVVTFNVIQEFPWSFSLVLPAPVSNQLPATAAPDSATPAETALESLDQFFVTAAQAPATTATKISATYQVNLAPPDQGEWILQVHDGMLTGKKGRTERPDVILEASASGWIDITTGKVDSLLAFFLGKLKVTGNLILARRLRDILPPARTKALAVTSTTSNRRFRIGL